MRASRIAEHFASHNRTVEQSATQLGEQAEAVARVLVEKLKKGNKVIAFGNGGSSTDAAAVASLFGHPPSGRPLPARSLAADLAVLTALANDVGYELVFSRQLASSAGPTDIALGLSTSGSSVNLLRAFEQARQIGALTIGLAGYGGGTMAEAGTVDHCLVVSSDSVHRIQEAQSAVTFELWRRVQGRLVEEVLDDH